MANPHKTKTGTSIEVLSAAYSRPMAPALLAAAPMLAFSSTDISPLYARSSEAEENLEDIAKKLGLDPWGSRVALSRLTCSGESLG